MTKGESGAAEKNLVGNLKVAGAELTGGEEKRSEEKEEALPLDFIIEDNVMLR